MNWPKMGAALMFLAVALGAFGAHALKGDKELWKTAALYHALHALALLTPAGARGGWWFVAGIALFSGSLYALALTEQRKLGMIAPLGGLAFLIGWLFVLFSKQPSGVRSLLNL